MKRGRIRIGGIGKTVFGRRSIKGLAGSFSDTIKGGVSYAGKVGKSTVEYAGRVGKSTLTGVTSAISTPLLYLALAGGVVVIILVMVN